MKQIYECNKCIHLEKNKHMVLENGQTFYSYWCCKGHTMYEDTCKDYKKEKGE